MADCSIVKFIPRSTGYSAKHTVPAEIVTFKHTSDPSVSELNLGLTYLRNCFADIRTGDIVEFEGNSGYRNDGITIFDGKHLVDLYRGIDENGMIPRCFRVILGGVPVDYWHSQSQDFGYIAHNYNVWFNHHAYISQCVANIKYGFLIKGFFAIFTTFVYNNILYTIVYEYCESINPKFLYDDLGLINADLIRLCMNTFRNRLTKEQWLPFCCTSAGTYPDSPNTLYLPAPELSRIKMIPIQ